MFAMWLELIVMTIILYIPMALKILNMQHLLILSLYSAIIIKSNFFLYLPSFILLYIIYIFMGWLYNQYDNEVIQIIILCVTIIISKTCFILCDYMNMPYAPYVLPYLYDLVIIIISASVSTWLSLQIVKEVYGIYKTDSKLYKISLVILLNMLIFINYNICVSYFIR